MAFRDQYTDFTFDDKKSSSYKVWITNKNDLQLALTPNFKDKFTSPQFGGVRYLDGTTIEKTDIKFSCIAIDVTSNEWRAICNWLSPTKVGKLSFNFNHYTHYNVKLSSTVTAKMFNYGGKDSLIGGRKIIEFSLSFTTVGDYAAFGPINTGLINFERTYDVNNEYTNMINELIMRSANHYHMPCIYADTTQVAVNDYVTGLDLELNSGVYPYLKWQEDSMTNHQLSFKTNTWEYIIYPKGGNDSSDYYYRANHNENYISVLQPKAILQSAAASGESIDHKEVTVDNTGFNIFNIGEYEAYPRIMLNSVRVGFEVWLDDTLYYSYTFGNNRTLNNIVIDCQSGIVTYNGRILDNAVDAFGYKVIVDSYNLGPMAVPSGEPEIHLGKLTEVDSSKNTISFVLAEPLIDPSQDSINLGVSITKNITTDTKYSEGLYDHEYYEPHMLGNSNSDPQLNSTSFYQMDVHNYVEVDNDNNRKITLQLTPSKISSAWDGSKWVTTDLNEEDHKDQIFYLSFCKGHRLTIKTKDATTSPVPVNSYLSMQSRGAI